MKTQNRCIKGFAAISLDGAGPVNDVDQAASHRAVARCMLHPSGLSTRRSHKTTPAETPSRSFRPSKNIKNLIRDNEE